ncbi:SemiSWEET transporter [uncultured Methanomethylovorans sp.]|uniref:SemiSWEET transporter n=1 Tax=uncultured Methanomethylovorans sp. TaxID=183759 RepID=UPI002AA8F72C|nr:SemiSWEET transporter [uncultured Methanomethylovorans sp.]
MIGYLAGTLTTLAFAPQLLKTLKTKSTKDISLLMLLCSTTGMTLWLYHGLLIKDMALIVANSVSIALASMLLVYKLKKDYWDLNVQ